MPSYNQSKYIERSILSVINQDYANLEFIIIDGGSTDGSVDIINKYADELSYWYSGPDRGQSDALNHGVSRATGEIIGWLNSDDLYLPGALKDVAKAFRDNPHAKIIFGDWWEIDEFENVTDLAYAFNFSLRHFVYEGFHLNSQAMFIERHAFLRFGKFDVGLHRTMDYDMILRLGLNEGQGSFKRIGIPLACFRRHAEQKTVGLDPVVVEEHLKIAAKYGYGRKYSTVGKLIRAVYRLRRAYWLALRGGMTHALTKLIGSHQGGI